MLQDYLAMSDKQRARAVAVSIDKKTSAGLHARFGSGLVRSADARTGCEQREQETER